MLFEQELPKDNSPIERLNVTYVQIYYSDEEMRQFKDMCKCGMMRMWPDTYRQQNVSDFIFELVKNYTNGSQNI
jgi:hypothetical protein